MCAAGTLTLQVERQKVGSDTTGLIQEKNQKQTNKKSFQSPYPMQILSPKCFAYHALMHWKKQQQKKYFPPSKSVHCSPGKTAWVCVKFKFLMTALGKRKENNEIKPLPPDLGWDVTACLFSPAPVFSQLSNLLCSCGSMIQREEKKKRRERGRKKQQLFFASLFHLWLQALGVFARSKTRLRVKGRVFQKVKRLFLLPQARWIKDSFKVNAFLKQEWKLMI